MTVGAVQLYDVIVALHVVLVIFAFGVLFAFPWLPVGGEQAHRARLRILVVMVERGGLLALASGLYLAVDGRVFGQVWVLVPLGMLIAVTGIAGSVLIPRERELAHAELPQAEQEAQLAVIRRASLVCVVCVAVAVLFMVTKLGDTKGDQPEHRHASTYSERDDRSTRR